MRSPLKFPRIPHVVESPGIGKDDLRGRSFADYCRAWGGVIVTEKMDGENTTMMRERIYARSPDSRDHPSRHKMKALWAQVRHSIPEGWRMVGENCSAKHNIHYQHLNHLFYIFAVIDQSDTFLPWEGVCEWAKRLEHPLIGTPRRFLLETPFYVSTLHAEESKTSLDEIEGFVFRNPSAFKADDAHLHLAKWVRAGHVGSDEEHWMHNPVVWNVVDGQ